MSRPHRIQPVTRGEGPDCQGMNCVPRIVSLPSVVHPSGELTIVEALNEAPFPIARVYFLHHLQLHAERGSHAHRCLQQLFLVPNGSYTLRLSDSESDLIFQLDDPSVGVYVPPGWWRTLQDFTAETVCLVLASRPYDEEDYIRDWDDFIAWRRS